jgi:hypothetical protein
MLVLPYGLLVGLHLTLIFEVDVILVVIDRAGP